MRQKIEVMGLEEAQFKSCLKTAKSLFSGCLTTWPLHYLFYYLGHIPKLDAHVNLNLFFDNRLKHKRFIHNISSNWHLSAIRLALHIWGKVQKEMARRRDALNMRQWGATSTYTHLLNTGPLSFCIVLSTLWQRQISNYKHCKQCEWTFTNSR